MMVMVPSVAHAQYPFAGLDLCPLDREFHMVSSQSFGVLALVMAAFRPFLAEGKSLLRAKSSLCGDSVWSVCRLVTFRTPTSLRWTETDVTKMNWIWPIPLRQVTDRLAGKNWQWRLPVQSPWLLLASQSDDRLQVFSEMVIDSNNRDDVCNTLVVHTLFFSWINCR